MAELSPASSPRRVFPRLLGAATAGYGAAVLARPRVLAGPCGLIEADGRLSKSTTVLSRAVGARDLVSGLAMAVAPSRLAMTVAIGVRVACDASDAVVFGRGLPEAKARRNAALVAGGWAAVCALSFVSVRSRR
ncbi:hypothetical protein [Amycolatopsis sp. PS_44_ISF1]|uniref:hypothetical protein n=1 Tax=Amycolatopsis sp. PS_44_ISF1 TaxID=2974917 RepID=UPI0028DE5EDB|nr:hypothetical protein [Amycolatopsis sp. PS_44_ISF1]MDT8914717.1 hypothetical protein [Amycolatopsis sp. PS_44_ISF1]